MHDWICINKQLIVINFALHCAKQLPFPMVNHVLEAELYMFNNNTVYECKENNSKSFKDSHNNSRCK